MVTTSWYVTIGGYGKFTRISLQCDFRLELAGKEVFSVNGQEDGDCSRENRSACPVAVPC